MTSSSFLQAPAPVQDPVLDRTAFRSALGSFATGVTIVCARGADGQPVGITANSFSSVSLDPPLVLWSLGNHAYSLPVFENATHFVIHVLGADQLELANRFATRGTLDKFATIDWHEGPGGAPVLAGAAAHFECARHAVYDGGDHRIFLGRVLGYSHRVVPTLAFHRGGFAACTSLEAAARQ